MATALPACLGPPRDRGRHVERLQQLQTWTLETHSGCAQEYAMQSQGVSRAVHSRCHLVVMDDTKVGIVCSALMGVFISEAGWACNQWRASLIIAQCRVQLIINYHGAWGRSEQCSLLPISLPMAPPGRRMTWGVLETGEPSPAFLARA